MGASARLWRRLLHSGAEPDLDEQVALAVGLDPVEARSLGGMLVYAGIVFRTLSAGADPPVCEIQVQRRNLEAARRAVAGHDRDAR